MSYTTFLQLGLKVAKLRRSATRGMKRLPEKHPRKISAEFPKNWAKKTYTT
jgi:hypothetical protein